MTKQILYLGNKLSNNNQNVSTVESLSEQLSQLSYDVKSYSNQSNKILRLLSMLWAILKYRRVDYILIYNYSKTSFLFSWSSAEFAKILNKKYILMLHGGDLPKRLKRNPKICKSLFSKAYINITPSKYLYKIFTESGFSNIKIIPNTIHLKNYTFKERSKLKPKLLWVRAFADIYNPILALKVLKLLLNDYPDAELSMVGPFKDESIEACRIYAKKHQLPVKFTGKMSKTEWIDYAKEFDVFINTTNVDNTPVSVIEAMALGLPIVTTNVGGLPYLLNNEEQALLVKPDDEKVMVKAIISLLQNHNLAKKLSQNGRELAETFDWEIVKEQWQKVLK